MLFWCISWATLTWLWKWSTNQIGPSVITVMILCIATTIPNQGFDRSSTDYFSFSLHRFCCFFFLLFLLLHPLLLIFLPFIIFHLSTLDFHLPFNLIGCAMQFRFLFHLVLFHSSNVSFVATFYFLLLFWSKLRILCFRFDSNV